MSRGAPQIRVLHILSGDLWAGAEVQAFTLLTALSQMPGVEVRAAVLNHGELSKRLIAQGIAVEVLDERKLNGVAIFSKLRQLLRTWQPNVVHTHRLKENVLGSIANRLEQRVASIRTEHGASEHNSKSLRHLPRRIIRAVDRWCAVHLQQRVIAVTDELASKLAVTYKGARIAVVENGVHVDGVRKAVAAVDFREYEPTATHIGIVGRLVSVKRVDLFLQIAADLLKRDPGRFWRFHIFGDGPLRTQLTQQAADLSLMNRVTFHGHRDDIVSCIAALDALIMCSDHEGMPMTLLEAMAVGTPIVAHDTGGMHIALTPVVSQLLVSNQSAEEYSAVVLKLLNDPDIELIRKRLGERVIAHYSARANATKILAIYRELIDEVSKS